jgi:hypothetical protein
MMAAVLRQLMVVLSVLAFASGMTIQATPSAQALGLEAAAGTPKADAECPRVATEHRSDTVPTPLPCKGIMLDCVKQMGCLGAPALPDHSNAVSASVAYSIVAYWLPSPALSGRDIEPDLFPPIAG